LLEKTETDNLRPGLVPKRLRPSDPEAGPCGLQTLPRRERTPESQLLFLVGFLWKRIIGISIISYGKNSLDLTTNLSYDQSSGTN